MPKILMPYSDEWEPPKGTGTKFLVRYLLAEQTKAFDGKTILDQFNYRTLQHHMKLLLKEYDEDLIKRGIAQAAQEADHPFSIAFIKEKIEWLKGLWSCDVTKYHQNRS